MRREPSTSTDLPTTKGVTIVKDLSYCRQQFPSLARTGPGGSPLVFLDGPGGTQVPASVIAAIADYYVQRNSNTHGQFVTSRETDLVIKTARTRVATFLGAASSSSISFGQNTTTLNFLLSQALADMFQPGDEIVVTDLDHDANIAPWLRLQERGLTIRRVPVLADGKLDLDTFKHLLTEKTQLVAVGWASNALGTVNPLQDIRRWTDEVGAWLLVDAVHWAPHGVIDVEQLHPDFLLCSAYKFFGPHVGILYTKPGILETIPALKVRPQTDKSPERIETGTLNHAALAGVSAAIEFIAALADDAHEDLRTRLRQAMNLVYHYEHDLASRLYRGLQAIPRVKLYGPAVGADDRAPTLSFTVADRASQEIAERLGDRGILAWDGDFYAATAIDQLGLRSQGGLVRLGLAPYNTRSEVERTLAAVEDIAAS